MNQDHKSLVDAFLKWYKTDPHHENRNAYPELKSSVYLEGLNKEDFIEYFFQFVKEGGGIQGGGQRGAGEFKIAIARDFENFRSFVLEPYGNKLDLDNWLKKVSKYTNLGRGGSTIYLNRIDSNRFVIVNNKSINALNALSYVVKGDFVQIYHSIEEAQKDLISKYSELEDYYMTDALTHFLIGTKEGQIFLPDPFLKLLFQYIELKKKNGHADEFYKYEAIKHFQDNWDNDALDFAAMLDNALKKQVNLMYQLAYGTIRGVAKTFPKETSQHFRNLFDESKELISRLRNFETGIDSLMKKIDNQKTGFQDERTMAVYLTFRYPDKYYFFKDSFYSKFVDLYKEKKVAKGLKYAHYLKLCNQFKGKYVMDDDELWAVTNSTLPSTAWPDHSRTILTQDILYCGLEKKESNTEKPEQLNTEKTIEMKENINYPKNLILYGPPGTGKTYHTIGHAMQIAAPDVYERFKNEIDRDKLVEAFNRLRKNKQIEFVTFHQSFGYEEFVEGIKPIPIGETGNEDGEEMIYKVSDGIFKRICGEAEIGELQGSSVTSQISPESRVFKVSLKGERNKATKQQCFEKNEIRIGWEKTGSLEELFELQDGNEYYQNLGKNDKNSLSYFYNMEEGDIALIFKDTKTIDAIGVITGDYTFDETLSEYNHVRKVKWLLKGKNISIYELNGNTNLTLPTVYQLSRITPAMVSKLVQENSGAAKIVKESKNYVLIIDEINRGNISKIFGELITLIEPDKRQGETNALEVTLPYSKTKFSVPSNLYIIGTMNTADRSIALIDTALRRRFEFKEMIPNPTILSDNIEGINLQKLLETINERITFLLDRDHTIGHAYLIEIKSKNALCNVFRNQIIPLLQEYFYTDWRKIQLVLGDNDEWGKSPEDKLVLVTKHYNGTEEKNLFGVDLDDYEEQEIYELNPLISNGQFDNFPISGFVHIYERPSKG